LAADALDLVLLGPVGAGKGTQARLLAARYGIPHVASGDLLRAHRQRGTELGKKAQSYMERGALVPDNLVIDMILDRIRQPDAAHGVLLDGFPRTVAQAQALDTELTDEGRVLKSALYLRVPRAVLMERAAKRWTCPVCQSTYNEDSNPSKEPGVCDRDGGKLYQREDDRPDVVGERIRVYLEDTVPVVDYYRARGILEEIDGTREIQEVAQDVGQRLAAARA
jgi:adenylate kinase